LCQHSNWHSGSSLRNVVIYAYIKFATGRPSRFQRQHQWRRKALMGRGSTVTWGPSLSLPSTSPSSPSSPPSLPSSSSAQPLPCREAVSQIQLGGLGERCKLPSGVWGGAPVEIEFGAFYTLCSLLLVFFEVGLLLSCLKFFCGPTTRGPRSSGAPVN